MHESSAALLPRPGDLVLGGRYRVENLVGRGGMGVVMAVRHELLEQRAALKLLLPDVMNEETARRFLNEARASVRIRSEHVAKVMDVGTLDSGVPFILMELLDGHDLGQLLKKGGRPPIPLAVDYCIQALEALSAAHALHIVHRDLKPSNLFLATGPDGVEVLKVLDFGISKSAIDTSPDMAQTSTRALLGSPLYISPEQFRSSRTVDSRADIWAMGIILYELLTGAPPFAGETLGELFIAILEQPLVPVIQRRPDVPPALDQIVSRCLQRDRDQRFADVAELAYALAPFGMRDLRADLERMRSNLSRMAPPQASPPTPVGNEHPPAPVAIAPAPGPTPSFGAAGWAGRPHTPTPGPGQMGGFTPGPPHAGPAQLAQSASAQRAWAAPPASPLPPPRRGGTVALVAVGAVSLAVILAVAGFMLVSRRATSRSMAAAGAPSASTATLASAPAPAPTASAEPPAPATATASAVAPTTATAPATTLANADPPPPARPAKPAPSAVAPPRGGGTPAPPSTSILDKRR
jgi:eukaryotic-like serine/threonine-protein kinase